MLWASACGLLLRRCASPRSGTACPQQLTRTAHSRQGVRAGKLATQPKKENAFPSAEQLIGHQSQGSETLLFEIASVRSLALPLGFIFLATLQLPFWTWMFINAWNDKKKKSEYIEQRRALQTQLERERRRAKELREEVPEEETVERAGNLQTVHWIHKFSAKNNFQIVCVGSVLGGMIFMLGTGISLRFVTRWTYDFSKRVHHVQTLTPLGVPRWTKIDHSRIKLKKKSTKDYHVVRAKGYRFGFVLDVSHGFFPNLQQSNMVFGV